MRAYFEDKITMYATVSQFLNDNNATWSGIAAIATAKTDFDAAVAAINNATQNQIIPIIGAAVDKEQAQIAACEAGEVVAAIIYSYAIAVNDNTLAESVNFPKRKLFNLRDTIIIERLDDIIDKATDLLTPLTTYGLTQPIIDDLEDKRDTYNSLIPRPRISISSRKSFTTSYVPLIREADKILNKRLDKLMKQFRTSDINFYNTYLNVREIINTSGSGNKNALTVSGFVTDNATGARIANATIILGPYTFTSDANWHYSKTFSVNQPTTYSISVTAEGYTSINDSYQFSPGKDETQNINMQREFLTTFQNTFGPGTFNLGTTPAGATGLRITLISGTEATVGYSANGTAFSGNTETVNTTNQPIDRNNAELNGPDTYVVVQNNSTGDIEIRVDILA
jgi:hypothetical protein